MTSVLFLDAEWRPLRVEPWQIAIADIFLEKVEVVEYSRDRTIKGASREYPMPMVVRLIRRFKRDRIRIKFSRLNIYARDGFKCQYCGNRFLTEDLTFDHVVPRAAGGKTTWENIVTCCGGPGSCNDRKGNRTPEQARMPLRSKPRKPTYLPLVSVKMDMKSIPEEWRPYWSATLDAS